MFYLDTSAVVAAISEEAHSEQIWRWLGDNAGAPLLTSGWVAAEVSSALSVKVRTGTFSLEDRAYAWNSWRHLRETSLADIAVVPDHFEEAARLCDRPELGLRASDALHVAIAQSGGLTLITLDTKMAEAAQQLGVHVRQP